MAQVKRPELTEEEYLDIEEAIASDARGRAFLRMREQRARLVSITEVRRLAREVKDALGGIGNGKRSSAKTKESSNGAGNGNSRDDAQFNVLREELREMSAHISQTRRDIAALRPEEDEGAKRLTEATGELEDIVSATEAATSEILSGVERIHVLADMLPKEGPDGKIAIEIQTRATEALTACSFQDITGTRITQVVNTLRYVEQRVNAMLEIWGLEPLAAGEDESDEESADAADGAAPPRQEDMDAMFERLKALQEKAARKAAEAEDAASPS
jgi:chemotaxis regulatin CheY-phosphate phosphatase CheZ